MNEAAVSITTSTIENILFYAAAFVMLPLAYGVLFDRNIIRAGFLLIGVFGGIALLFLLLQAQFLAMAQMMIYAVGITLVVVIALMITNAHLEYERPIDLAGHRLPAFFTCGIVFIVLYMAILSEAWPKVNDVPNAVNNVKILGTALLTQYALPFEFASILLLVSLMGAVMLAKSDSPQQPVEDEMPATDDFGNIESERKEHVVV